MASQHGLYAMHQMQVVTKDTSQDKIEGGCQSVPAMFTMLPAVGIPEGIGRSCIACQLGTKSDAAYISSRILKRCQSAPTQ